jgi:hypothetical protein
MNAIIANASRFDRLTHPTTGKNPEKRSCGQENLRCQPGNQQISGIFQPFLSINGTDQYSPASK